MKNALNDLFRDAESHYKNISDTYKLLEKSYEKKISIHSAGQWLLDNMYIIEEEYQKIKDSKRGLKNKRLPIIKTSEGDKYISIFFLAYELVEENKGYIDQNIILNCLKEHQKLSYLTSEELDLFILMLQMSLLKFISRICLNISNSQLKKIEVEKMLEADNGKETVFKELYNEFKYFRNMKSHMSDFSKIKSTNTAFVEYMAYRVKQLGKKRENYYKRLNEEAEKIGFTVEEAIIKEHMEISKTTDYIGRAILAFKQLQGINFREIFEKVNKIDETLKNDYTDEFRKCDYKTKGRYRKYIIKLAKKYNLSEVYVAKKAVECSVKYKKHVGFFLIGEEKYLLKKELGKSYFSDIIYNNIIQKIKPALYIILNIFVASLVTTLLSPYIVFFDNIVLNVVVLLIVFSFALEITIKLVDYFLRKIVKPKILPRFDFAKTVDKKYPTYVVMPTIISSIEKLDAMIKKMEITYLANRSENMYYMLLGDCMASDKKVIDIDKKIVAYAKEKLEELNNKYPSEHVLFNFMYRKRVYSKGEKCYMGWERKRGGLQQFNQVILGKLSKAEIDDIAYLIYDDIVGARYAITVDEDTMLSLNTAKDLVAIIAHPLNKPILSKDKKTVIKGYGLIQPSVGLDIESANKSIFSKIFGGFGGLDIYTNAVADVYQDCFEEAIFCGKGIYDIELFDNLLSKEIPENLVLSHDLLEGSFLKAGLASDIELQDGFPNNYISYMKRNHRWYRGDMQITKWLFSPKSKLSILSKWKIFDNLRRPLLDVIALTAIILSAFVDMKTFLFSILVTFLVVNFGTILGTINRLIFGKVKHSRDLQYIPIIHGFQADLLTVCFNFLTMPYKAWICISAFSRSIYRMLISHKKLLEWTTGEMLEKASKSSLSYYYTNMIANVIFAIVLVFIPTLNNYNALLFNFKYIIATTFFFAPFLAYLLGKDHLLGRRKRLDKKEEEEILEVAKRTWFFFDSMMTQVNNYLPTDNYQENRRYKIANRTSSTNIGMGILAIITAYDLKFISKEETIHKLKNVYNTLEKLEKWNGHLYNWYNIKTLEPLRPRFVSTVDSGNFVACLYVARQFINELKNNNSYGKRENEDYDKTLDYLYELNEQLINDTDFSELYDTSRNLFHVGYAQENGKLVDSYYDMLMSENRTASLIAIARRQVTSKHWFALSRNLVKVDGYKGLISWAGTSFEYFMPYIFNKSYEHTLIDQSLFFNKYSQLKYAKDNQVPWGVSESAFAVKDNELNYQYQEFGIPWLGLKRGLNDYMVVAPYASILTIEYDPYNVYKNIKRLKKIGAYSSYGFYEAIDYTKEHIGENEKFEIVKTYMAHHQGMILASLNNYLNKGIIKERFHQNPDIRACDILLKERERLKATINKSTVDNENVFKQKNIQKYTTFVNYISQDREIEDSIKDTTSIAMLKGLNLSTIVTNSGDMFIKYKDKIINKQRYTNLSSCGNYIYLTDKVTGKTISAMDTNLTHSINKDIKKSLFNASLNKIEAYLENDELETTTTMYMSPEYNMEIKKVSIYNNSNVKREIIINTYIEMAMTDYMTNVVHPSFSNLQIETYYDENLDILVASKRKKNENDEELYVYAKLIGIDLEKEMETEKQKLVKDIDNAYNETINRYPLWPVLSYRARIILDAYERQEFYYVLGVSDSKYKISNAVINLDNKTLVNQFKLTGELNSVTSRYLQLEPGKAEIYNNILKEVLFNKISVDSSKFWDTSLSQSMLWKYSISGDLPILLIYIDKIEDAGIISEVIKFMDYVKNRKIDLDIIVLINEKQEKDGPLYIYVKSRIDRAVYMDYSKGNIFILNVRFLDDNEVKLLSFLAKKYIQNVDDFLTISEIEGSNKESIILEKEIIDKEGESINEEE